MSVEPNPRPGAPRYWRRVWNPPGSGTTRDVGGVLVVKPEVPEGGLVIYGYGRQSAYAEDRPAEDNAWRNGRFSAECFSQTCPEGEWGSVPLAEVQEITLDEFEAARARGWKA